MKTLKDYENEYYISIANAPKSDAVIKKEMFILFRYSADNNTKSLNETIEHAKKHAPKDLLSEIMKGSINL